MIQAPEWLPYRWRERWDQSRVLRALKGLDKTAPIPAAKPHEAPVEAHILFGRRDLELGLLAIKSLLYFTRVPLAVTCTSLGLAPAEGENPFRHACSPPKTVFYDDLQYMLQAENAPGEDLCCSASFCVTMQHIGGPGVRTRTTQALPRLSAPQMPARGLAAHIAGSITKI